MVDSAQDIEAYPPPYMAVDEPKGYGLSGKIMLSAIVILFAVVVIMVCLHVYARWYILRARRRQIQRARRRTHLVFYIEPNDPSNIVPIPARGLDASVLKSLPTFTYTEKGFEVEVKVKDGERETKNENEKEEEPMIPECAVCLSEFEEGERGRLLPKCNHKFHVECIDMWFHSHSTCPICRSDVDSGESVASGEDTPAPAAVGGENGDVVVELTESTQGQLGGATESAEVVAPGPSRATAVGGTSFGGRRKGLDMVGVSIEVPPRRSQSFSFTNSDESGPSPSPSYKSPTTSRILSLKRILSRDKKSPLPSPSGAGSSCYRPVGSAPELDLELGRVDESTQSLTPR